MLKGGDDTGRLARRHHPADAGCLGFGDLSDDAVLDIFKEIATTDVEPDGVVFEPASITVARIREEDAYGGRRVMLSGHLASARLRVQIDIGIGDAVFPNPEWIELLVAARSEKAEAKGVSSGDGDR